MPHRRLSYKLSHYGITSCLLTWIENFFTGRVQRVLVDGQSSDPAPVDSGVPQGTVTGLFADDCLIYAPVRDSEDKSSFLQDDLIMLEKWQDDWMMQFNPSKCATMLLQQGIQPNVSTTSVGNNWRALIHIHTWESR